MLIVYDSHKKQIQIPSDTSSKPLLEWSEDINLMLKFLRRAAMDALIYPLLPFSIILVIFNETRLLCSLDVPPVSSHCVFEQSPCCPSEAGPSVVSLSESYAGSLSTWKYKTDAIPSLTAYPLSPLHLIYLYNTVLSDIHPFSNLKKLY